MKTLHLVLKKKWFDMIASGEKKEEYRDITPFWVNRLATYEAEYPYDTDVIVAHLKGIDTWEDLKVLFNQYDKICFQHGYATDAPRVTVEWLGIEVATGKPEWGAEPGIKYFVIKLGNILSQF